METRLDLSLNVARTVGGGENLDVLVTGARTLVSVVFDPRIGNLDGVVHDGKIELFFGDRDLPNFVVPNPTLAMIGLREGGSYAPMPGTLLYIQNYQPGETFASNWGAVRIGKGCAQVSRQTSQPLPEL